MKSLLFIALTVLLFSSCSDPNVYTALGIYKPDESLSFEISSLDVKANENFNLLSITPKASGTVKINYKSTEDHRILRKLSDEDLDKLIELMYYIDKYGKLDDFLSSPLSDEWRESAYGTISFVDSIIENVKKYTLDIIGDESLSYLYTEEDIKAVEEFFDSFKGYLNLNPTTIKDFLAIQLALDTASYVIEIIHEIIIELPSALFEYDWESLGDNITTGDLTDAISKNATEIASLLLSCLREIDLIGSLIPDFINLSTLLEIVL